MSNALKATLRGVGWGGTATVVNVLFQLLFMAVMARLLDPSHFGLLAMANLMLRFLSYFAQLGITSALIQKEALHDGDIRAALVITLAVSGFCTALALLGAPWAAAYLEMPDLASIIQVLSVTFLINGFAGVSQGLLRRNLAFKGLAIIEILAYVLGYGAVGLSMALSGAGVWSLVGAVLAQSVITAVGSFLLAPHELGWRHHQDQRRHFVQFGFKYSVIGFIEFLSGNLDALIVGKLLGAGAAGIYNRASLLSSLPIQQPANLVTRALFPVISRLGSARQFESLQLSTLVVGTYAFAVSWGMLAAAPTLVAVLLGDKWLSAVPIVQILCLAIGPQYLAHLVGVTLDAQGVLRPKLIVQSSVLAIQLLAFMVLAAYGLPGIAFAMVITEWTRFIFMAVVVWHLHKPKLQHVQLIFMVVLAAGLCSLGLITLANHVVPYDAPRILSLLLEIAAGALALLVVCLLARHPVRKLPVVAEILQRMPALDALFQLRLPRKTP